MSKLLNKPLRAFTWYALLILLCSIPVYYLVVDYIWLDELDKHNHHTKELIRERLQKIPDAEVLNLLTTWNALQPGSMIVQENKSIKSGDSLYTVNRKVMRRLRHESHERYRGLSTYMKVNGKYYYVTVETNVEEADETIVAIAAVTGVFFTLLFLGFILLNRKIAGGIWQPFQNTLAQLKSFDLTTEKNIEFEKSDTEEFEELNQTLQKLIKQNISVFSHQKKFIENASHELQTPLAVLKSKIDLLLQDSDLTLKQSEILNAINIPLSRVSRINKNLLLLAKIENSQFADTEKIDLSTHINDSIDMLSDYIADKNLSVSLQIDSPVLLDCNKFLLEILISNLLTNAIRHNTQDGNIAIVVFNNKLLFCNSGAQELSQETLFQRFSISSSKTTNSGLGLAIVKEICNRYQWRISYGYHGQHCFSINF